MDTNYIGMPIDFRRLEGTETIDFHNTFDLNGTQNDEMLRLYLRTAGLSDQIEYLTIEQRRAFIYDIIRSNKLPGFWLPSTFKNSIYKMQRPQIQNSPSSPTTQLPPSTVFSPTIECENQNLGYATMRSTASCNSLQSLDRASPILPHRFVAAPTTPPSPTTFITSSKGNRYEISGPMNFQHTAGDMTRDRTRNAFDLSTSNNDNVLRKYMIERGITEEDVAGMRKTDIIRKIVQSKFTWMPQKSRSPTKCTKKPIEQQLHYATISRNSDSKSFSSSPSYEELSSPSPITSPQRSPNGTISKQEIDFSNYTLVTSRFADVSQFPAPNELLNNNNHNNNNNNNHNENNKIESSSKVATVLLPPLPPNAKRPAPPPRKSQQFTPIDFDITHKVFPSAFVKQNRTADDYDNTFETIPIKRNEIEQQKLNAPSTFVQLTEPLYVTTQKPNKAINQTNQATKMKVASGMPPPPPPPTATKTVKSQPTISATNRNSAMQKRPPLPPNIKPQQQAMPNMKNVGTARMSRPPTSSKPRLSGMPPPPPPPMPTAGAIPHPPPPMAPLASTTQRPQHDQSPPKRSATPASDDGRDALLDSIRQGVTLKKVNQKAATISGVKPRAERKPQPIDLLSELKLGITLRRVKNPADNPFAANEPDESQA